MPLEQSREDQNQVVIPGLFLAGGPQSIICLRGVGLSEVRENRSHSKLPPLGVSRLAATDMDHPGTPATAFQYFNPGHFSFP